jgi:hypothetical protein
MTSLLNYTIYNFKDRKPDRFSNAILVLIKNDTPLPAPLDLYQTLLVLHKVTLSSTAGQL